MANGKSTWKYNKLLTARRNYYLSGGLKQKIGELGQKISDFAKSDTGASVLGTAASVVGGGLNSAISGGLQSGAGNFVTGLSSITSQLPGFLGPAATLGVNILGGGINKLLGSKENTENIARVKANINELNNFQSSASDFDQLAEEMSDAPVGMSFDKSFIGEDGVWSSKIADKTSDLRAQIEAGKERVFNSLANNNKNLNNTQMYNLLGNYAAYGGELNTQGGDFTNGLLYINNGGSHESNPHEGVPVGVDQEGVPNLVEEGETIFNDYVFSRRLMVPKALRNKYKLGGKKSISFADMSKELAKESEERPNDPISKRGMQVFMTELASAQEQLKAQQSDNTSALRDKVNKFSGEDTETNQMNKEQYSTDDDKALPTYTRLAPIFGAATNVGLDLAGITNNPDYAEANTILNNVNGMSITPVRYTPSGVYLNEKTFDRNYYTNTMTALANASRRGILNTSGGNRGAALAGILASDTNYVNQLGNLARQAEEFNVAQSQKAKEFNRTTDATNAQGFLQAGIANQKTSAEIENLRFKGLLSAMEMKQKEDLTADTAKSANFTNLLQALGDLGFENFNMNMSNSVSPYYKIGRNGKVSYTKAYNKLSAEEKAKVDEELKKVIKPKPPKKKNGGYLTVKSKKR